MKYTFSFQNHEPSNTLLMNIDDKKYQWVGNILKDITTIRDKELIEQIISEVKNEVKNEDKWWNEVHGVYITKDKTTWFDGFDPDHKPIEEKSIETIEFESLLQAWWAKYIEVNGEPQN